MGRTLHSVKILYRGKNQYTRAADEVPGARDAEVAATIGLDDISEDDPETLAICDGSAVGRMIGQEKANAPLALGY
jgi:hypothetical protein